MKKITIVTLLLAFTLQSYAQVSFSKRKENSLHKFYLKSSGESLMFGFAKIGNGYSSLPTSSALRFSWFFNTGTQIHYNLTKNIAIFSGIELRNMGYITKTANDSLETKYGTLVNKVRNYDLGIPLGLKFGNLVEHKTISLGTGLDIALNTKEKMWIKGEKRSTKIKNNDWFSNNANLFNPYFFIAIQRGGIGVKAQFYTQSILKNIPATPFYFSLITDLKSASLIKFVNKKKPTTTNDGI